MKKSAKKLPDKPSALIRVALRDLEAIERSQIYRVEMADYHAVVGDKCEVCFAGAVMAKTLGADRRQDLSPADFPADVAGKLSALNEFRTGSGYWGFDFMKLPAGDGGQFDRIVTHYDESPKLFKKDMRRLASDLRKAGY